VKPLRALIAVAILILVIDGGILFARSRDSAAPVTAASAVARFRGETRTASASSTTTSAVATTTTSARSVASPGRREVRSGAAAGAPSAGPRPAEPSLPSKGVYIYTTTGSENVDVLGGARHEYPPETTITLRHEGCGMRDRWDALRGRWDARHYCTTERGLAIREVIQHHEFYGRADERTFVCDAGAVANPRDAEPGSKWTTVCRSDDAVGTTTVKAIGFEDVVIAGAKVRTFHFHSMTTVTGASRATQEYDDWMVQSTGLLVRRVSSNDARTSSPVGTAHYQEHYELRLTSLTPRT
jgi:hypothetical protein